MKNSEKLYPGKFVVDDYGICKIIDVDDDGIATAMTIIPKETFIEAYNKFIKGGDNK